MRGSSSLPGGPWTIPLIAFAGIWEVTARLVHRTGLFPTFIDTLGSLPPLLTDALIRVVLGSLISVAISFAVAAGLALGIGAVIRRWGAWQSGSRVLVWLAVVFLSLSLTQLAVRGFGSGSNAVYMLGGGASFLLMLALQSGGVSGMVVLDLGLLAAWVGVLSAESSVGGQGLGALVQTASQDSAPERFYALCLLAAMIGLALVTIFESLGGRLNLAKGSARRARS
ncbi:MAG: hypothetical protein EPO21_24370 [Chloroflexota bacterium]|nr:MAG: hypothetical protein EPO21_24370 [Chloroflexota bacterium]